MNNEKLNKKQKFEEGMTAKEKWQLGRYFHKTNSEGLPDETAIFQRLDFHY